VATVRVPLSRLMGIRALRCTSLDGIDRRDVEVGKLIAALTGGAAFKDQAFVLRNVRARFFDHAVASSRTAAALCTSSICARVVISVAHQSIASSSSG